MVATGGRFSRMSAGIAANGVMMAVQLFIRLAEVPIFLTLWGAIGYGEWLIVAALPTALLLSDGGFTKAAQREMAMRAGRNHQDGVRAVFQSAWLLLTILTVIVLLIVSVVIPNLPLASWLNITTTSHQGLSWALIALAAQVLVYFQSGLLFGAFASHGRYATGVLLIAASSILCFLGLVGGAATGGGLPAAACGSLLGQIVGYVLMLGVSIKMSVSPGYGAASASWREIRLMWSPSVANLAFPLADAINNQGLRIIVGLVLGPAELVIFSTTRTLCRLALQPVLSIARTLEPELSLAYGARRSAEAKELFIQSSHLGFWLSTSMSLILVLVGPLIYRFWVGEKVPLEMSVLAILLCASIFGVLWGISLAVPGSINKHGPIALPFICLYGLIPTITAYILAKLGLGVPGAAVGVLLGDMLALCLTISLALNVSGVSLRYWCKMTVSTPGNLLRSLVARFKEKARK